MNNENNKQEPIEEIEETIELPIPEEQEKIDKIGLIENKIYTLKQKLSNYDYIGVKIATGRATIEDYSTQIEEMKLWTKEINELEEQLKEILLLNGIMK